MRRMGRERVRLLSLMAGGLVFCICSWQLGNLAIERVLETDAKATADEWADYLSLSMPGIDAILAGTPAPPEVTDFVSKTRKIGSVFRYRLYDQKGVVRLDSHLDAEGDDDELPDSAPAIQAFQTGTPIFKASKGDGTVLPSYYAEAYLPLALHGKALGTLEVYVDQTDKALTIRQQFVWTALEITALTALGFLLPLGAYLLNARESQKTIAFVTQHDDLTQLHNRTAFKAIINGQITSQANARFDVFFIDLDQFKAVNDSKGHAAGDAVLRQVATRLRELAGAHGEVARLGGDEFAIFQPWVSADETSALGAQIVASLGQPFEIDGGVAVLGGSAGVSSYPVDGGNADSLLKAADIALYEAKQNGRGMSVRFQAEMEERVKARHKLENRLRSALARNEFALFYQPLLDLGGNRLAGFEALLRLWDDDGLPISPATFIPVAEKIGLIEKIGQIALNSACMSAALWPDNLKVAVNLSPLQFQNGELLETVRLALANSGLAASRLELEITEGVLIGDTAVVLAQLKLLKALGVSIALDDFGTGYSSLSYLWMFPFDRVKVDRSFISRLTEEDGKSREILQSILALGRSLEISITAEGVETAEQSAIVKAMRVDTIQGYLYGHPVPETELAGTILRLTQEVAKGSSGTSDWRKQNLA